MAASDPVAEPPRGGLPDIPGYELLGELGRGGMGVVYRARHLRLDRVVALKMVLAARAAHFLLLARFRVEAEAVARLAHPNIVRIHEVGVHEGSPYVALEYAPGGSLSQKTRRRPQPPAWAARLAVVLAEALRHAHKRGILHRDLKPANVLLMADGTPKITDFGLAKLSWPAGEVEASSATICMDPLTAEVHRLARDFARDASPGPAGEGTVEQLAVRGLCRQLLTQFGPEATTRGVQAVEEFLEARRGQLAHLRDGASPPPMPSFLGGLTEDGAIMGTPHYMAPEQASGRLRDVGRHTDVYSLGAVLYELLTGDPPFTGGTKQQILERVLSEPPPPLPASVPGELRAVCLKCLEKRPEDRYANAADLGDALQGFLHSPGVDASAGGEAGPVPTASRPTAPQELSTDENAPHRGPGAIVQQTRRWWRFW
jgi:serine/threonine protein kinase